MSSIWPFLAELRALVDRATRSYDAFDQAQALQDTESFFWTRFTDTYLELAKVRARGEGGFDGGDQASALATLRFGLSVLLRLFAPVLPYICEEVWSWSFAAESGHPSIHRAPWPSAGDFAVFDGPREQESFSLAIGALAAIHKAKADASVSMGKEVEHLTLAASPTTLERVTPVLADVFAATRCAEHALAGDMLDDGSFAVREPRFAD